MPIRHLVLALLVTAVPWLAGTPVALAAWRPPVEGAVTRPFDPGHHPFEGGRHRGVDLAAPPGTEVRAPCAGRVAFAGRVGSSGRVVTLRCGGWRVTHLPLATLAVGPGAAVEPGEPLGTVAASPDHHGLHLGVRREGTRFGYADPLRFLARRTPSPPLGPAPKPGRPRPAPPPPPSARPPALRPVPGPRTVRPPAPRTVRRPAPRTVRRPAPRTVGRPAPRLIGPPSRPAPHTDSNPGPRAPFAPWPAWLGLALVLAGAGVGLRGRLPKARPRAAAAGTVAR